MVNRRNTLQENMKLYHIFYDMFCKMGAEVTKCSFYGDENVCPVRCEYAIKQEHLRLQKEGGLEQIEEEEMQGKD